MRNLGNVALLGGDDVCILAENPQGNNEQEWGKNHPS